jgi:hypothetical protein
LPKIPPRLHTSRDESDQKTVEEDLIATVLLVVFVTILAVGSTVIAMRLILVG